MKKFLYSVFTVATLFGPAVLVYWDIGKSSAAAAENPYSDWP